MKKILIILVALVSMLGLASCDIQISDPNISIDSIEKENVDIIQIQNELTQTIKNINDRCVGVVAVGSKNKSTGSGVIYKILDRKSKKPATKNSVEGICYVITNEHVIKPKEKNTTYRVYIGTEKYYFADCIGSDAKNDLAVLKFTLPLGESTIQFDDFENLDKDVTDFPAKGSYAIAIGCPLSLENFNYPTFGLVGNVSLVSITHSAALNPGSSGGGLFNTSGRLIGINVSKKTLIEDENKPETQTPIVGINRAIPIWTVKKVIKQIEEVNDDILRPNLGIEYAEINQDLYPEYAEYLPTGVHQAIIVQKVIENTNAANLEGKDEDANNYKSLMRNDIIVGINNEKISKAVELEYFMNGLSIGSDLKLNVYRLLEGTWVKITFRGKLKA